MPSKLQTYMQMADEAQRQITGSYRGWTSFLTTAARLYKYPYAEQVMIHAQRPDATACAEYDFWNEKMDRYVRRGSKGIALIDSSGERPRLRYVFDVSDTGGREFPKSRYLWEYREEHADAVSAMLESRYGVDGKGGFPDQLERIASQLAEEYWRDYKQDILAIVDDSFLYGYDEFNVGAAFQSAAAVSIAYSLMSRCGLEADDRFEHEDFLSIFDFNTPEAAAELGTAVSRINGEVLRQIEVTIKNYEREKLAERSHSHDRADLHQERGLPDSRPDAERDAGGRETPGQVRETAQELPSGAQTGAVQPSGAVGEAVPAPAGDRRDGEPEAGADDAGADEVGGRDGGAESPRPDEMGGADEQPESAGGGDHPQRAGIQLTDDVPEAEPAQPPIPQAYQLSLFPTEDEQIAYIAEAESYTPSAFSMSIPQSDIDHILRMEGNADYARMKIATEFSKGKGVEEIAAFLQSSFHGGNGVVTENGRYSAWYADDGIHIANGDAARYAFSATTDSFADLQHFFPNAAITHLENIEGFHRTISAVFKDELRTERRNLDKELAEYDRIISEYEAQLQELIQTPSLSKVVLTRHAELLREKDRMEKENEAYEKLQQLKKARDDDAERLKTIKERQLTLVSQRLNEEMKRLNDAIYKGSYNAPILSFSDTDYKFFTPDDTGTGIAYKGLVVYDLAVLNLTKLPILVHDSVVLKQISDDAIEKIIELYSTCGKQVIIALDKQDSYSEKTSALLSNAAVLKLAKGGQELFGRSWG